MGRPDRSEGTVRTVGLWCGYSGSGMRNSRLGGGEVLNRNSISNLL